MGEVREAKPHEWVGTTLGNTRLLVPTAELKRMQHYDYSMPTGPSVGRIWVRDQRDRPNGIVQMARTVPHPDPGRVGVEWREVIEITVAP